MPRTDWNDEQLAALVRSVVENVITGSGPALPLGDRSVSLGADHGGFPLKDELAAHLRKLGWKTLDRGTHSREAVDYPDYAVLVARDVSEGRTRFGIMVDGAGIGSCMAANKIPRVRAALCYDVSTANNAREHNDANLLTLGAGLIGPALARQIVTTFLTTECTEERHLARVAKITALDRVQVAKS